MNARTNSAISSRLDHLTERFNQLDQCRANNRDDLLSLRTLIDQLCTTSDTQFSSLKDQLQVLSESSSTVPVPTSSAEVDEVEHTVVIEGLRGGLKV